MPKLVGHIVIWIILLHLPVMAVPHLIMPDLVAVIILVAKMQNPSIRFWGAATIAGLMMDILGGLPIGLTAIQYLTMLYVYSHAIQSINKPSVIVLWFLAALSYITVKVVLVWCFVHLVQGGVLSKEAVYAAVITGLICPLWHSFVRYNIKAKNA